MTSKSKRHIGVSERPRALTAWRCVGAGRIGGSAGRSTGVASISNKSSGVHCKAVHNAISVVILIWVGSLVNSADTDAARHLQSGFVCQQPAQLGPGPHFALGRGHPQSPLDPHARSSSPLSSARVVVTARRYASSMKVADGRTYRIVDPTVQ